MQLVRIHGVRRVGHGNDPEMQDIDLEVYPPDTPTEIQVNPDHIASIHRRGAYAKTNEPTQITLSNGWVIITDESVQTVLRMVT